MGECPSVCKAEYQDGKIISGFSSSSQIIRKTIVEAQRQHQNEEENPKTVINVAKTKRTTKEDQDSPDGKILKMVPHEKTRQDQDQPPSKEEIAYAHQKEKYAEVQTSHKESKTIDLNSSELLESKLNDSLSISMSPSHLNQMHQQCPQLLQPSIIRESVINQWHSSSYTPSNLFININYDQIFTKK